MKIKADTNFKFHFQQVFKFVIHCGCWFFLFQEINSLGRVQHFKANITYNILKIILESKSFIIQLICCLIHEWILFQFLDLKVTMNFSNSRNCPRLIYLLLLPWIQLESELMLFQKGRHFSKVFCFEIMRCQKIKMDEKVTWSKDSNFEKQFKNTAKSS